MSHKLRWWAAGAYWRVCTWLHLPFWLWYRDGLLPKVKDLLLDDLGISAERIRSRIEESEAKMR